MKRVNSVSVKYLGADGRGRNKTEARKDAERFIESAMAGSYLPEVLTDGAYSILVYRDLHGWRSGIVRDKDDRRPADRVCYVSHGYDCSRAMALSFARSHLAQLAYDPAADLGGPIRIPDYLRDSIPFADGPCGSEIEDYKRWVEFQRGYRAGRAAGLSDVDAHNFATRNPIADLVQLDSIVNGPAAAPALVA